MGEVPKMVRYRDMAGHGVYDAAVQVVRNDRSVDIEVQGGFGLPLVLTRVRFSQIDTGNPGCCFAVAS